MTRGMLLITLVGCTPSADGTWTGECLTTDAEVRVRLTIDQSAGEDGQVPVRSTLHLADRPMESLQLECDELEVAGSSVDIRRCFGFWTGSGDLPDLFDFAVDGVLDAGEPTDTMGGRCTFEGGEGPLDLVRTP